MKIALITLFSLFFTLNSNASNVYPPDSTATLVDKSTAKYLISEGKKLYNLGNYRAGLVKFREALVRDKKNPMATYWVGECHFSLGNYKRALKYAKLAYDMNPTIHSEINYLLGASSHNIGLLDDALTYYTKSLAEINETRAKSLRIPLRIEEVKRAKEMIKNKLDINITALGETVNSKYDEYAPILSNDGKALYFSARRADNKGAGISPGDRKYYSDIYVSYWDENTNNWGKASNITDTIKRLNSKGFDDICGFSPDGKIAYLSINTDGMSKPKPKTKSGDIYYAKLTTKGTWGSPKALQKKTINTMFFDVSPSFTADGNTMYFVSERIGGEGKSDIWVSRKISKNSWSKPENLGNTINTPYNETTVFITGDEKYLFFSSRGHAGMGGYDVYYSVNTDGVWSTPKNLGSPINSVSEETHFQYYPKLGKAYYSKVSLTGDGGIGGRDIFEIDIKNLKLDK